MINLQDSFKITMAKTLTELAIQNNLIDRYAEEVDTANAICTFFKTIYENLDSNKEQ